AILQSALQIFSERGFDGASTRDIADHAKVHHALIKYYFNNKETLWRSAVTFLFDRQAAEMSFERPTGKLKTPRSRREYAREVLRHYVLYCARHPEHARLMMQESVHDTPRLEWAAQTFISGTARSAEQFVRVLQREGVLPEVSVPALVYIIVGGAQLFYALAPEVRHVWGVDPSDEAVTAAHIEALLAVLVR
ncbi:MAG: TetR family transcriptional regulator, partial [Nevskia sp.]|nr:TetR family transcriptional regulator [Nevskia sp.]